MLGLEVMSEESSQLGLEINWRKTKIQASESIQGSSVPFLGHQVNLVDTSVYLGSFIDQDGGCDTDIRKIIELARYCTRALDHSIWRTSVFQPNSACITFTFSQFCFVVLTADTWSMTVTVRRRLDAFDQWCLQHILRIPYTAHVPNLTVRKQTKQEPSHQYHPRPAS